MANPIPRWYESTDTSLAPTTSFGQLVPGVQTAEVELHLWNDAAGVDPMVTPFVSILARYPGEPEYTQDHVVAAMHMVYMRAEGTVTGGVEPIDPQTTVVTAVGRGRWLTLLPIPAQTARKIFISMIPLPGIGGTSVELQFIVRFASPSIALDMGHAEAGSQGVITGYDDGLFTEIYSGGAATASGSPDNKVHLSDIQYLWNGYPYVILEHDETLDGNDSAAVALASGQSYWDTISVGGNGVTHTKSLKGSSPLPVSSRPFVPAGERLIAYVERKFSGVINTGDIYRVDMKYGFFNYSFSGLNVVFEPGQALVSNCLIHTVSRTTVPLVDNASNYIWLMSNGQFIATDGARPYQDQHALYITFAPTASGAVTTANVIDGRQWVGSQSFTWLEMRFASTLTVGATSTVAVSPRPYDGYISFFQPPVLALDGTGTGTGQTIVDIERSDDDGATWASIYTSAPSPDRRLRIASAATARTTTVSVPEDLYVGPGRPRFRAKVIAIPGSTAPAGGIVMLGIETAA